MTLLWRRFRLLLLALSAMLFVIALPTYAATTPEQNMQRLDAYIEQATAKAETKDFKGASASFEQYKTEWFDVEDGVKQLSAQAYKDIEGAMGEVKFAFYTQPLEPAQVLRSLKQLHAINQKFIAGRFQPGVATAANQPVTIASMIQRLERAEAAIAQNNLASAIDEISKFKTDWLQTEGIVKTKSKDAYVDVENNMAKADGFLHNPADVASAKIAIANLKQDLQPYAASVKYGLFDAAVILLREGLEAILVLVALLAFLNKSGNGDKSHWLWIGAGVGILASILTAVVIINLAFAQVGGGANRETLEGITGLFAAIMLFYVSYWLHTKSSIGAWQGYIHHQMSTALATNSIFSLAFLAFLAVFREGAETTLFYIGIAPSISTSDLYAGLALGAVLLIILTVLMLGLGLKLPMKPFFLVTSILIYYLGFKFIGAGIHSLQVAGICSATPANFLPSSEGLGLYPTWETTLPQLAVLLVTVAVVIYTRHKPITTT